MGLGLVAAWWVVGKLTRPHGIDSAHLDTLMLTLSIGALIGARAYHVIDLFEVYRQNPAKIIAVWEGGLGIYGAILGGLVAGIVLWKVGKISKSNLLMLFDAASVGMPLGQAIGRIGNYLNRELFGLPTELPWAIAIPIELRPAEFRSFERFHPLFFYEAVLNLILFGCLWFLVRRLPALLGTGKVLALYLVGYGLIRFFLEPLRIDPWIVGSLPMASVISLLLVAVSVGFLVSKRFLKLVLLATLLGLSGCTVSTPHKPGFSEITIGTHQLQVEVVRTPAEITQGLSDRAAIGSDGMLFVMPSRARHSFWMPRMQFDIDIVWIDCAGRCEIRDITANVPKPLPSQTTLPTYQPKTPVSHVLELPAGMAEGYALKPGVEVEIPAHLQILP